MKVYVFAVLLACSHIVKWQNFVDADVGVVVPEDKNQIVGQQVGESAEAGKLRGRALCGEGNVACYSEDPNVKRNLKANDRAGMAIPEFVVDQHRSLNAQPNQNVGKLHPERRDMKELIEKLDDAMRKAHGDIVHHPRPQRRLTAVERLKRMKELGNKIVAHKRALGEAFQMNNVQGDKEVDPRRELFNINMLGGIFQSAMQMVGSITNVVSTGDLNQIPNVLADSVEVIMGTADAITDGKASASTAGKIVNTMADGIEKGGEMAKMYKDGADADEIVAGFDMGMELINNIGSAIKDNGDPLVSATLKSAVIESVNVGVSAADDFKDGVDASKILSVVSETMESTAGIYDAIAGGDTASKYAGIASGILNTGKSVYENVSGKGGDSDDDAGGSPGLPDDFMLGPTDAPSKRRKYRQ